MFEAEAGRLDVADSVLRDYTCFASPLLDAAYYYLDYEISSQHIADLGYRTTFTKPEREWSVDAPLCEERHLERYA